MSSPIPKAEWERIAHLPEYQHLLGAKRRFIFPASVFFIAYYFSLPVLVGWFPDLMKKQVLGELNLAYLFALSQFFMAWTIAYLYVRKAAEWDRQAASLLKSIESLHLSGK